MQKRDIYTLGLLIILTLLTAFFSTGSSGQNYIVAIILLLSCIKFALVAFNFMKLKKANSFWKIALLTYLAIFITTILFIV